MGTWGFGPFDNDAAADWLSELVEVGDVDFLLDALTVVRGRSDRTVDASQRAVAAAEVIAAIGGKPCAALPSWAHDWVARECISRDLMDNAISSISDIETSSDLAQE